MALLASERPVKDFFSGIIDAYFSYPGKGTKGKTLDNQHKHK